MVSIIKDIKKYIKKYKVSFTLYCCFSFIFWIISTITPLILGKYIDNILKLKSIQVIYKFCIIMICIYALKIIINFINKMIRAELETKCVFDLRYDVINHVKKLPITYFKGYNSAYQNQQIADDCNAIMRFTLGNLIDVILNAVVFIFAIITLIKINVKVTIFFLFLVLIYTLVYIFFKKPLFNTKYKLKQNRNIFFGKVNEQLSKIKFIKINSFFESSGLEIKKNFQVVLEALIKSSKVLYLYQSIDATIFSIAEIMVLFVGGLELIKGNISVGNFTIINSYFIMLITCISGFLNFGEIYQDTIVSYTRITNLTDLSIEQNGDKMLDEIKIIEVKDLTFGYDDNKIINNLNLEFKKGFVYCIQGRNGAGKSTLINIIIGLFNNCYSGQVLYNGLEISKLNLYELRKNNISITEQEPTIFDDTIINNITYGTQYSEVEENKLKLKIGEISQKLNLTDFIENAPDGLNTIISSTILNTSGGEKQKLSLVRALIKNPNVLILDEPTSALDKEATKNLVELIKLQKNDRMTIIITHSKEFNDITDEVIYIG